MSIEEDLHRRFKKTLWSRFLRAIRDYELLGEGDRVCVCISGGKDSTLMALLFLELIKYSDYPFEAEFLVMDPGYGEEDMALVRSNLDLLSIPAHIRPSGIFDVVSRAGGSPCYLCARMRRGSLYAAARELGCNKIALGHHFDDVVETILMGMLFGSQMQSMRPRLRSEHFDGMELIRPMYLIREEDIISWADYEGLSFIHCACPLGVDESASRRAVTARLIRSLRQIDPDVDKHIFKSASNVMLDTLIAYKSGGVRHHFLDDYTEGSDGVQERNGLDG